MLVLTVTLALIATASWLRLEIAPTLVSSLNQKIRSAERVIYYVVNPQNGPGFRLNGAEQEIRIMSHLALPRSAAWPAKDFDPLKTYEYGLAVRLLDDTGTELWRRNVYQSTRQSKASHDGHQWIFESVFSENQQRQLGDMRVLSLTLPPHVPVDAILEIRFLGQDDHFALVRAYRVAALDRAEEKLRHFTLSPAEKQGLVSDLTFLEWDEIATRARKARLATRLERLAAVSDAPRIVETEAVYLTDFRLPQPPVESRTLEWLGSPWERDYVVEGPSTIVFEMAPARAVAERVHLVVDIRDSQANLTTHRFDLDLKPHEVESLPLALGPGLFDVSVHAEAAVAGNRPTDEVESQNDASSSQNKKGTEKEREAKANARAPDGEAVPIESALGRALRRALFAPKLDTRPKPSSPLVDLIAPGQTPLLRDAMPQLITRLRGIVARQLTKNGWNPSATHEATIVGSETRLDSYYVDASVPVLHFPVHGQPGDARSMRLRVRAIFPERPAPPPSATLADATGDQSERTNDRREAPIAVKIVFLDASLREIGSIVGQSQQPYDVKTWVQNTETIVLHDEIESQMHLTGVSKAQEWKVIAPAKAAWLGVISQHPALIEVHAFADYLGEEANRLAQPFASLPLDPSLIWQMVPEEPRLWYPLRAREHNEWRRENATFDLTSMLRFDLKSEEASEEAPQAWAALDPLGRPERQRILETYLADHADEKMLRGKASPAERFVSTWTELIPDHDYTVVDDPKIPSEPRVLYRTTNDSVADPTLPFAMWIDQENIPWRWRTLHDAHTLSELRFGRHQLRWTTQDKHARLWIDRPVESSASRLGEQHARLFSREFVQRTVHAVGANGIAYRVFKPDRGYFGINVHLYRRASRDSPLIESLIRGASPYKQADFFVEIDHGNPVRFAGELTEVLTRSRRVFAALATEVTPLVFLDDSESGSYEDYSTTIGLGDDISPGWHTLIVRPMSAGRWWARAFVRNETRFSNRAQTFRSTPPGHHRAKTQPHAPSENR
jgi:hypothetical protein